MHINSPFFYGGHFQDEDENQQFIQRSWNQQGPARREQNQRLEEDRLYKEI